MSTGHCNTLEQASKYRLGSEPFRKKTSTCEVCGKVAIAKPGVGRLKKYCSPQCRNRFNNGTVNPKTQVLNCLDCGKPFEHKPGVGRPQAFCSNACRENRRYRTKEESSCQTCGKAYLGCRGKKYCSSACWPKAASVELVTLTCERCGDTFERPHDQSFRRFCSRDCSLRSNLVKALAAPKLLKAYECSVCQVIFTSEGEGFPSQGFCSKACKDTSYTLFCEYCHIDFVAKTKCTRYCSQSCSQDSIGKRRNESRVNQSGDVECVECKKIIRVDKAATKYKYCSLRCLKKVHKRKRRAMKRNAFVETVHLGTLILRDCNVCQICMKTVNLAATVPDDLAPTVDHVIPLSKGGEHSYANCQLAHFICNSRKNAHVDTLF